MAALEERYQAEGAAPAGERSDVSTLRRSVARGPKPAGPGITWRDGRVLGDGSRRGAGWVRRMTVYLPPELARRLEERALADGEDRSALIASALGSWLDAEG